jgi:RING-box protein 1
MSKLNIQFKKSNIFATWSFKLENNTHCSICRQNLNNPSIYNKKSINDVNVILKGTCGHLYHKECITPWASTNKNCPNCSKLWLCELEIK